jgi:ATP/maltotriose-dependent transcriptional regulator MalT
LWGEEALQLSRALNDHWNIAWSLSAIGFEGYMDRPRDDGDAVLDESIALFRELDDPLGLSHALRRRTITAFYQNDYIYAETLVKEALSHDRAAQDKNATAWELLLLGNILWRRHRDPGKVIALYQESIALFRELHDALGMINPLVRLAYMEQFQRNFVRADTLYREALRLQLQLRFCGDTDALAVAGMGALAAAGGQPARAAKMLSAAHTSLVKNIAFAGQPAMDVLEEDIAAVRARLGEQVFNSLWSEGQAMTFEQAATYALEDDTLSTKSTAIHPLADPLTERELEILRMVAAGLNSREIAQSLVLSVGTIRWYIKQIYGKLDAHSRAQALARAREMKLLA